LISRLRALYSVITPLAITIAPTEVSLRTTILSKRMKATPLAIKIITLRMDLTGSLDKNCGNVR
jgi:hypothetical protein